MVIPFLLELFLFGAILRPCQGLASEPNGHRPGRLRRTLGGLLGVGLFSAAKAITFICLSTIGVAAWCYPKGIGEDESEPAKFLYFGIFGIVSLVSVCNEKGADAVLDFVIESMEESRKRR